MMFATVDLPEPDSPTSATVVPFLIENDTSSTALKSWFLPDPRIWNTLVRFSTTTTSSRLLLTPSPAVAARRS